jgi:hypothetical protein
MLNLAEEWRELAARALDLANELPDKASRDAMRQIADIYISLAEHADRKPVRIARGKVHPKPYYH